MFMMLCEFWLLVEFLYLSLVGFVSRDGEVKNQ